MNDISKTLLKGVRKTYVNYVVKPKPIPLFDREDDPDHAAEHIYRALRDDQPKMIARLGATEIICVNNYIGVKQRERNFIDFITGKSNPWWWDINNINQMQKWSGFFPPKVDKIEQFCELMIQDMPLVDILGSWLPQERFFEQELKDSYKVNFELLNPYFSKDSWTRALESKKVLVVHPFTETIKQQYNKRELLFEKNLLPIFELKTVKAVQSIAGEKTQFVDWFQALEHMKEEIDKQDYDICLIGCGAYGFPLAAYVKRNGKKAFHLGGSLQLLFGIRGKRWEKESYNEKYNYARLINKHWVRPNEQERPMESDKVEDSCYW